MSIPTSRARCTTLFDAFAAMLKDKARQARIEAA